MKKRFIFFTLLLLTLIGGANWNVLNSQETITIGGNATGTSQLYPMGLYYPYTLTQQIYTSSDINYGTGVISEIAFKINKSNATRNVTIYMKNTDKSVLSGLEPYSPSDKVFHSDNLVIAATENDGWMTIDLDTDFLYEGQNIVVSVLDNTGSYTSWNSNLLYKEDGLSSGITYYGYNSSTPISEGNQPTTYWGSSTSRGSVRFTISPASASVKVSAESIALGNVRLGDYWTEKPVASANVEIKATATTITNISCDNNFNNFFTLNNDYDLNQNPVVLNVSYNKEANVSGAQSGNITITSADCEPVVIPVTATAYTPANGDVYENPITVNFDANNSFTAQATGMYDDYILPGEAADGNLNDAVYKFTLANDAVVTANVNGTNPIVAIYDEDFGEKDGPSSDNNNTGVQSGPSAPTTFFYDFNDGDLSDFTLIDADGDGQNWYTGSNIYIGSISLLSDTKTSMNNRIVTKNKYSITNSSTLQFKLNSYYQEILGIEVSENGTAFEKVSENIYGAMYQSTNDINISLSEWAGKEVFIAIYHKKATSSGGYKVAIDNLALTDGSAKSRAGEAQIDGVQYPAGTYYLVAAAEGNFTLNLSTASLPAPAEFAYTAPENNTIVEETNPELTWESSKYASSYDVYLGTTADALSKVAEDITATSFQTTGLSNNTKYYWQVVAKNSIGDTNGETWSFVTPLDVPQNVEASSNKIYPDNNNVTITWDAITGAKGYNVYVKVNGEGNAIKHNGNELVTTAEPTASYELSNMDYSLNGHVVYVTAVYEIEGGTYESNSSATQTIKVTDYTTLSVTVKDANEKPIEGATIVLQGKDEFGEDKDYNNLENGAYENGTYTLEVLPGTYTATITKLDYNDVVVEEVTLSYAQQSDMDVVMQSKPSASFTVNAEEGSASWEANYSSYNVYRRGSEGNVTSLATGVKAKQYQDTEWETLADGEYEYGVSAMMELNVGFEEGFENGTLATGWSTSNNNSYYNQYDWTVLDKYNSCNPYSGNYAIISKTNGTYNNNVEYHNLITPEINLSAVLSPKLEFYYFNKPGAYYGTSYTNTLEIKVKLSSEDDNSWKTIKTYSHCNNWTKATITTELEAYKGKSIKLAFVTNRFCCEFIALDDIVLTANAVLESRINWSDPVEKGGITFIGDGNWNTEANWNTVPTKPTDKVTIKGNATITEDVTVGSIRIASDATLTVEEGVVLNVTNGISNTNAAALVMEDGAQIIQTNSNVAATFNMTIANPDPTQGWGENKDGWQFIASPLLNAKTSAFETSGENNDFDLYKYDGTKKLQWVNYKNHKRVGDTFEHNFNDGSLNGWTNLDATYQWNIATGGINSTYCLTSANSGTSYIMSPKVLVEKGSKFYFTARSTYDQNIVVAVSETGSIDDMATKLTASIGTSNWQWQGERYVSLDEYDGKEIYIVIKTTSVYNGWSTMLIDNLRLTNAGGESDGTFETEFVNGRAYLASYQAETTATFTGVLNNATSFTFENISFDSEGSWANFHLLGNPFSFDMDMSRATAEGLATGYAIIGTNGGYTYAPADTTIAMGDGFFVQAIAENLSFSYDHKNVPAETRSSRQANSINVIASGKAGKDNVIINFAGQAEGFSKLQNFNDEIATVFVANNGKCYGIANVDENVSEVELSFVASQMGNYSISLDVNGEFEEVTLVDRFTGIETNMLLESKYNFTATANDNPNRFVIRLANSQEPTANSNFVYQSGEELIVDAEGTIQIIDVMGRMVYSNDVESSNNRINVSNLKGATYIVRNISNNTVRTQKIVIL